MITALASLMTCNLYVLIPVFVIVFIAGMFLGSYLSDKGY